MQQHVDAEVAGALQYRDIVVDEYGSRRIEAFVILERVSERLILFRMREFVRRIDFVEVVDDISHFRLDVQRVPM